MTISAVAGTSRSTVSHFTRSTGSPRIAPITSYSQMPGGTGWAGPEATPRAPPHHEGDRHRLAEILPGGEMVADMLRTPDQHRDDVARRNHAAIDADIHHAGFRMP